MITFIRKLSVSCEKATRLIEKKSLDGLPTTEKISLSIHIAGCKACKQYQKQSHLLSQAITQQLNEIPDYSPKSTAHLENPARQRIQQEINNTILVK